MPGRSSCASDAQRVLFPPVGLERDRVRRPGLSARLRAPGRRAARELGGSGRVRDRPGQGHRAARRGGRREPPPRLRTLLRGALRPPENDSAFLLDVHRRAVPARADGALRRLVRGRPGDRRRRRRRRDAGPAPGPPRLEGGGARSRARSGIPTRTGCPTRRARTGSTGPSERVIGGERPGRARQEQLRPRRRRLDGPLRRLLPALSSLRLRSAHARRGGRGLADLLRGPQAPLRAARARAAGGGRILALGRPAPLPAHPASDRRRRRRGAARARASWASRCASARWGSPTARSATAPTASTAASACRAAR